jgi:hypothetical protein
MPMAALKSGLRFTYPAIDDALAAIVGRAQISCAKPLPDCAHRTAATGFLMVDACG